VRAPRSAVNRKTIDLYELVLEKPSVRELEFTMLKCKVMIASDTHNPLCRRLREPAVSIIERWDFGTLETAKVPAVNQDVAIGNGYLSMFAMGVRDDAKGWHLVGDG